MFGYQLITWLAQGEKSLAQIMHPASLPCHCVLPGQEDAASNPAHTVSPSSHGNTFPQIPQQTGTKGFLLQPAASQGDDVWQGHSQCWAEHGTSPALAEAKAEVLPAGSWKLMEQDWQGTWAGQQGHTAGAVGMGGPGLHPCGSKSKPAPEKCSPSTPQPFSTHGKTGFPSILFPPLLG